MKVKMKRDDAWTKEKSEDGLMMMLRVLGGVLCCGECTFIRTFSGLGFYSQF